MRVPGSWRIVSYRRWDGTQDFNLEAEEIFSELSDSLLYHGDPMAALRELLAKGIRRADGEDILGLREVLARLKERREQILQRYDPSGRTRELDEAIREIVAKERAALERFLEDASGSSNSERIRSAEGLFLDHELELDALGPSLSSKLSALSQYDFISPEAKAAFDDLLASIREEFSQSFFNSAKDSLSQMSPESLGAMREMLAEMNSLIGSHQRGEDTSAEFDQFMAKYGASFPAGISNVAELLEYLAAQMSAASLAFGALSPEQQAELASLAGAAFSDLDLSWQMSQLMSSLASMVDTSALSQMGFRGDGALSVAEAHQALGNLSDLDSIETFLRSVTSPGDLSHLDFDQVSESLGEKEANSLARLAEVARQLEEAGLISTTEDRLELSARGLRKIGEKMLGDVFEELVEGKFGSHDWHRQGIGVDKDFETKSYEFGDPLNLSIPSTMRNAIVRQGGGLPLRITVDDFEIETNESLLAASTVLCLDLSLSMPLRDNFLSAKKVAMALHSLISTRYPKDYLAIVGFSEVAHEIKAKDLPSVSWDYVYGTNMEDALRRARKLLGGRPGTHQILMITDGEPTAHILPGGDPFFSYPPAPETIVATLNEVKRCSRAGIVINSFVLDANDYLRDFMSRVARINRGRVFYTDPANLGRYVLVDFLERHRSS